MYSLRCVMNICLVSGLGKTPQSFFLKHFPIFRATGDQGAQGWQSPIPGAGTPIGRRGTGAVSSCGKWTGSFNDQILCNETQSIATYLLAIIIRNHIIWAMAILPL